MIKSVSSPNGQTIYYTGSDLTSGTQPALIYFALSGEDSLYLSPFNQPAEFLSSSPIRVFSWTIPGHGEDLPHPKALKNWAIALKNNINFVDQFVQRSQTILDFLIENEWIDSKHIAVSGLSRGSFLATHLAAKDSRINTILGYAPLTCLDSLQDFKQLLEHPLVDTLALKNISKHLHQKSLRFYIGNHDTRVGTKRCFDFISHLVNTIYDEGLRQAQVELIISPSIGHKGHGTPSHIFRQGVEWIKERLLS